MIVYLSTIGLGRQTVGLVSQPLHIHTLFSKSGGRIFPGDVPYGGDRYGFSVIGATLCCGYLSKNLSKNYIPLYIV